MTSLAEHPTKSWKKELICGGSLPPSTVKKIIASGAVSIGLFKDSDECLEET